MSLEFSAAVRLRTRAEFDAVQKTGRRVSARYMTLVARPNGLDRDRLGIIASRRVGGSVIRNRAKRRLREMFRHLEPDAPIARGRRPHDVVAIARRELVEAPQVALDADFTAALQKLRVTR